MSQNIPFALKVNIIANNTDNIPTIKVISYNRRVSNLPSGALYLPPPPPNVRLPSGAKYPPPPPPIISYKKRK